MRHTKLELGIFVLMSIICSSTSIFASIPDSMVTLATLPPTGECTGIVSADGEPLIGATVRVKGTNLGVITDIDGKFTIAGVEIGATLQISYVGYKTQEIIYRGGTLNVVMVEDNVLEEVVVIGYGVSQKRTKVTNSIAKVSDEALSVGAHANPAQALAGAVAGVKVDVSTGSPAATPSITIRGGSNYDGGSNEPLVIVDGVIRSSLSDINANDIESMDILKDAGATALYGARAGNGVILITTKKGKSGSARVDLKGTSIN